MCALIYGGSWEKGQYNVVKVINALFGFYEYFKFSKTVGYNSVTVFILQFDAA